MPRWARSWGTAMLIAAVGAAPAAADTTPAGNFSFRFSSTQPGEPTALEFRQLYKNPSDPESKPSAVRRFRFTGPRGSVFDGSAVPVCKASDARFQQMGRAACPPESVVGTGFITVMTGLPGERPFPADATVFNGGDGIIELFTEQNTGIFTAIERPRFRGRNAFEDTDIAPTPGGPPDGESAAREAFISFPLSRGGSGKPFIRTPDECPASRRWTARFEWTNADGSSYSNKDDMTCARSKRPRTCLARRVRIGRRNIGRLELGQTKARTARRARPLAVSRRRRVLRYCVKGPDRKARSVAVFDRRNRARVVVTNARGHKRKGVGRGSSRRALRRRFGRRLRRLGPGLRIVRANRRNSGCVIFKIGRGRVRYVALADGRLARSRALLRRYLRRGTLR